MMDARIKSAHDSGTAAPHLPALNPHLTKSRLNDAPRLCEMLSRTLAGGGIERNKVEPVWTQGE
jgi:hypothetical protein